MKKRNIFLNIYSKIEAIVRIFINKLLLICTTIISRVAENWGNFKIMLKRTDKKTINTIVLSALNLFTYIIAMYLFLWRYIAFSTLLVMGLISFCLGLSLGNKDIIKYFLHLTLSVLIVIEVFYRFITGKSPSFSVIILTLNGLFLFLIHEFFQNISEGNDKNDIIFLPYYQTSKIVELTWIISSKYYIKTSCVIKNKQSIYLEIYDENLLLYIRKGAQINLKVNLKKASQYFEFGLINEENQIVLSKTCDLIPSTTSVAFFANQIFSEGIYRFYFANHSSVPIELEGFVLEVAYRTNNSPSKSH